MKITFIQIVFYALVVANIALRVYKKRKKKKEQDKVVPNNNEIIRGEFVEKDN